MAATTPLVILLRGQQGYIVIGTPDHSPLLSLFLSRSTKVPISEGSGKILISTITVPERRRKQKGDIEELADSIDRYGLFHPVIVRKAGKGQYTLVAGERRLLAYQALKREHIEARLLEELDKFEAAAVELEENARRLNMTWQEEAEAVLYYHEARAAGDPDWTMELTADSLGLTEKTASVRCSIARAVRDNPKKFELFETLSAAYNVIMRERQRAVDSEAAKFLLSGDTVLADEEEHSNEPLSIEEAIERNRGLAVREIRAPILDLHNVEFAEFLEKDLRGRQWNLLHCDFPYGVGLHESEQGGMEKWGGGSYEDTPAIFWTLCRQLAAALPHILEPTGGHMLFWYPVAEYTRIFDFWSELCFVNPVPLIWFKSDNTGILPDSRRGPRRVYEAALLATFGDRPVVSAVNNVIACPAAKDKAKHPSEKPFPVVSHFLRMLCDETTKLLDPSCGAGTALAAAEFLGAQTVTGVEPNGEHCRSAREALAKVRIARMVS